MKKLCIICDLDGVLFDSREWHKHLPLKSSEEAWYNFQKQVDTCKPNRELAKIITKLSHLIHIVFLTGREETPFLKNKTIEQIYKASNQKLIPGKNYTLIMRSRNDFTPASEVKDRALRKLLINFKPILAIDDEKENIRVFKKHGIETFYYKKYL